MKTILVIASGTPQTPNALETGAALARSLQAHLECFKIHPDPAQTLAQASAADMGSSTIIAELMQALEDEDRRHTKRARETFDTLCAREKIPLAERPTTSTGITASWREETGDELSAAIGRARFNDLIVTENHAEGAGFPPGSAGALLIGGGRPLLIAPPSSPKTVASNVVIAWKDTAEAARALAVALPIIARAQKVVVLGVLESNHDAARLGLSLQSVVDYLAWNRIQAESRAVPTAGHAPEEALLAALQTQGADLLVMGGYGHSRVREMIFGGFTRRVLSGIGLPVLLCH